MVFSNCVGVFTLGMIALSRHDFSWAHWVPQEDFYTCQDFCLWMMCPQTHQDRFPWVIMRYILPVYTSYLSYFIILCDVHLYRPQILLPASTFPIIIHHTTLWCPNLDYIKLEWFNSKCSSWNPGPCKLKQNFKICLNICFGITYFKWFSSLSSLILWLLS